MVLFRFLSLFIWLGAGPMAVEASQLLKVDTPLSGSVQNPVIADFDQLIETLESTEGREKFIHELKTLRESLKPKGQAPSSALSVHTHAFFDSLILIKTEFLHNLSYAFDQICDFLKGLTLSAILNFLKNTALFMGALMVGGVAEYLFTRLFLKIKKQMTLNLGQDFMRVAYLILLKTLSLLLGLAVFIVATSTVLVTFHLNQEVLRASMVVVMMIAGGKGIIQLSKILINPKKPLMGVGSKLSQDILWGIFIFIRQTILSILMAGILLYGISFSSSLNTLAPLLEGIIFAYLTVLVFRLMSFIQRYHKTYKIKRESWPVLIKFYVVLQTGIILLFGHQSLLEFLIKGTATLLVLIAISLLSDKFPRLFKVFVLKMKQYSPTIKNREKFYLIVARLGLGILMLTILLGCLTWIWDDSFWDWVWNAYQQKFSLMMFNLFILVILGILLWEGSDYLLTHHFHLKALKKSKEKSLRRYETLMPLMRNTVRVIITLFVGLMIISECGFNITPILAGASVVGIALSLGAQSLVKDFINGCFIVVENTIVLGDYVNVGGHEGTVEALTLRSLTLRDSLGGVHTVPFSNITTIINLSKNFSKCQFLLKFDIGTPYEKVRKLLKRTGQALQKMETIKEDLLGGAEILGIQELDADHYTVKLYLTVAPRKQWKVEHLFLETLSKALIENKLRLFSLKQFIILENSARGGKGE